MYIGQLLLPARLIPGLLPPLHFLPSLRWQPKRFAKNIENLFIVKYGTLHLFAAGSCPHPFFRISSCSCCTLSTLFYASVCVHTHTHTTNAWYCCSSWGVKMIECLNSTFVLPPRLASSRLARVIITNGLDG